MSPLQKLEIQNNLDGNGIPAGGFVRGIGLAINWQEGPSGRGADRKEQTGARVEDVLNACLTRLKYYQGTKFNCPENVLALNGLESALQWLQKRNEDREKRQVKGTTNS